jgi:hypothetical protein
MPLSRYYMQGINSALFFFYHIGIFHYYFKYSKVLMRLVFLSYIHIYICIYVMKIEKGIETIYHNLQIYSIIIIQMAI